MISEFPQLDKWIDDWKRTREDDRQDAKQFPMFKKYVKEDTRIIQRLVRERKRLEKKYPK
jgi:hypothetical protein